MIRFNANIPQFHKISDAYDFHTESKEPIRLLFDEEKIQESIADLFKERYLSLLKRNSPMISLEKKSTTIYSSRICLLKKGKRTCQRMTGLN